MSDFACPRYEVIYWVTLETCLTMLLKADNDSRFSFAGYKGRYITRYQDPDTFTFSNWNPSDIGYACGYYFPETSDTDVDAKYKDVLFLSLNRHWGDFLIKYKRDVLLNAEDISDTELSDRIKRKLCSFLQRMVETGERFYPLLTAYRSKYTSLLAKIETETETVDRFNDTPQIPDSAGAVLEDDPYVTNLRKLKSLSKTDPGSIPSQLEECYRFLHNILEDWANQLDLCFVPNIEED